MNPTVGRIVHYHSVSGDRPAIVTQVNDSGTIILTVFYTHETCAGLICHEGEDLGCWSWPPRN